MKTYKTSIIITGLLMFSVMFLFADMSEVTSGEIKTTPELKKEFPIKAHHEKLSFDCVFCHENQGNDPKKFKSIGDKACLSCHKTKEFLATRLKFMDELKVNPHNSIHDGPILYCDECHNEHKPSINMCTECHEHEVKIWMKETP